MKEVRVPSIDDSDAVIDTKSVKFCKISLRQSRIVVYAAAHLGEVAMPSIDVLCSHEEAFFSLEKQEEVPERAPTQCRGFLLRRLVGPEHRAAQRPHKA